MKNLFLFMTAAAILTGCIGANKYNGFVQRKYEQAPRRVEPKAEYLTVRADSLKRIGSFSRSTKVVSRFIPALIYWEWENTINTDLDPSVSVGFFASSFKAYADSAGLEDKLNDRKIELMVDQIPSHFVYTDKGFTVFLLVASAGQGQEVIRPVAQALRVRYRITREGEAPRTGEISVPCEEGLVSNRWKSTRKFTWYFLDVYEKQIRLLTLQFFDQFLNEL